MMINKGECILVRDPDNMTALCDMLAAEGYRCCSNKTLAEAMLNNTGAILHGARMGVRWQLDDEFPNCLAFCPQELYNDLANSGRILDKTYPKDIGVVYKVSWFDGEPVEVGDLL